jgi:AbiV family abortive infection protein
MVAIVSEQTLYKGSWHAMAQAGRLLRSAALLYNNGDSSSGVALAMFGREELGRSRLLRDCAWKTHAGRTFSVDDVSRICSEHVAKQEASAFSVVLRPRRDSQVAKALSAIAEREPTSDEYIRANKLLDIAVEAKRGRQPNDRHDSRCDSLYVDLNGLGSDWNCPVDLAPADALNQITEAVNDYALEYDRLTNPELWTALQPQVRGAEMRDARESMPRQIDIPAPTWPKQISG